MAKVQEKVQTFAFRRLRKKSFVEAINGFKRSDSTVTITPATTSHFPVNADLSRDPEEKSSVSFDTMYLLMVLFVCQIH